LTAFSQIAGFLACPRATAEQLTPVERWYRILKRGAEKLREEKNIAPGGRLLPSRAADFG